ncbi:hypothetical protein JKP88DRAFT_280496 [Tribonema minus]|uniref:Ankyrin repeat protein n=1 Tax=Tribonema minus TaxID=303371 RepID=A0A835YXW4_9STRA|nr:hypothetical protein JKP88DRAFT_280496 [Tribonema minus]
MFKDIVDMINDTVTLLLDSILTSDAVAVDALLREHGQIIDINALHYSHGYTGTFMHMAIMARMDCVSVVKALLQHGADVDATDGDGHTPLSMATSPALIVNLLDAGADANATFAGCPILFKCLHHAYDNMSWEMAVGALLDAGINPTTEQYAFRAVLPRYQRNLNDRMLRQVADATLRVTTAPMRWQEIVADTTAVYAAPAHGASAHAASAHGASAHAASAHAAAAKEATTSRGADRGTKPFRNAGATDATDITAALHDVTLQNILSAVADSFALVAPTCKRWCTNWCTPTTMRVTAAIATVTTISYCSAFYRDILLLLPAGAAAAAHGRIWVLKWMWANGFQLDFDAITSRAAEAGHIPILAWVNEVDVLHPYIAAETAAACSRLSVLQWLMTKSHDNSLNRGMALTFAAATGHHKTLLWLLTTGGVSSRNDKCAAAAGHGHLSALRFLRANGAQWDVMTTLRAAAGGHVEVLKWAVDNGCPVAGEVCELLAARGLLYALEWAGDLRFEDDGQS